MWNEQYNWFFEPGNPDGFNDPGISSFKSIKYDGLAREIIQNSIDAKNPDVDGPVKVVFDVQTYDFEYFPGFDSLLNAVNAAIEFIDEEENNKSLIDLRTLKNFLLGSKNRNKFEVMKISDYNTMGLEGSDAKRGTPWANLVRRSGNSNKKNDAGGSFGVGKYAPFVFSTIRSLIYSTKDLDGNIAIQGKSILSGHISNGAERSPKGYFGRNGSYTIDGISYQDSASIVNPNDVPEAFLRKEVGTSIFILNAKKSNEWYKEVQMSVINSFFLAILDNNLEVQIIDNDKNIIINKYTIFDCAKENLIFEPNNKQNIYTNDYLKIIKNKDKCKVYTNSFNLSKTQNVGEYGGLELQIFIEKSIQTKTIAHMRNTGMKIEDKTFSSLIGYVGILRTTNGAMTKFLRDCEGPRHEEWTHTNFGNTDEDEKYAKRILKDIREWERSIVKSLNNIDTSEKIDPFGMEEFLPSDINEEDGEQSVDDLKIFKPLNIEIKSRINSKQVTSANDNGNLDINDFSEVEIEGGANNNKGHNGNNEGSGAEGKDVNNGSKYQEKSRIPIKYVKTPYLNEKGKYLISFIPIETHSECELRIRRASDDNLEDVKINKLYQVINGEKIEVKKFNLIADNKIVFEVDLDNVDRVVLEVGCIGS